MPANNEQPTHRHSPRNGDPTPMYRLPTDDCCPVCEAAFGALTGLLHDERPGPGDTAMCAKCTAFLVLDENLRHRLITDDELVALPADARTLLVKAREAVQRLKARREAEPAGDAQPQLLTIESAWREFEARCVGNGASAKDRSEIQMTFYAGAMAMQGLQKRTVEQFGGDHDAFNKAQAGWIAELGEFLSAMGEDRP